MNADISENAWSQLRKYRKSSRNTRSQQLLSMNSFRDDTTISNTLNESDTSRQFSRQNIEEDERNDSQRLLKEILENSTRHIQIQTNEVIDEQNEDEQKINFDTDDLKIIISAYNTEDSIYQTQKFHEPMDNLHELASPKIPNEFRFSLEDSQINEFRKNSEKPPKPEKKEEKPVYSEKAGLSKELENLRKENTNLQKDLEAANAELIEGAKQKEALEEEMKALKALLNQTRKENSQRSREMTRNHEKQIQEMMQAHSDEIAALRKEFEQELAKKDEEYEILNALVNQGGNTDRTDRSTTQKSHIEEYEELIRGIKNEFENEITKLNKYYQNKLSNYIEEKEKLERQVEEHLDEICRLQSIIKESQAATLTSFASTSAETDKKTVLGDITNRSITSKRSSTNGLHSLISKINKYIDNHSIDEITPQNRKELYTKVSHIKGNSHHNKENKDVNFGFNRPGNSLSASERTEFKPQDRLEEEEDEEDFSFDEEIADRFNDSIKDFKHQMNNHY